MIVSAERNATIPGMNAVSPPLARDRHCDPPPFPGAPPAPTALAPDSRSTQSSNNNCVFLRGGAVLSGTAVCSRSRSKAAITAITGTATELPNWR